MQEAAPWPLFGTLAQSALYRIAMNIPQFLHELLMVAHIEVIIAWLPEVLCPGDQSPRNALLQALDGRSQRLMRRLTQQQMNMLGHDDVAIDADQILTPHSLQSCLEDHG